MSGCHSLFEIKQETSFSRVIAFHRFGTSSHVGSETRNLDSQMDAFAARLAALEQVVRGNSRRHNKPIRVNVGLRA